MEGGGVSIVKDRKGRCWYLSHRRCGVTEGIFVTQDELLEIHDEIGKLIKDKVI